MVLSRLDDLLGAPARQAGTARETGHRPWPLPERAWILAETLERQLFAHWRADAAALRAHLPGGLEPEERDGSAWLGVTAFAVTAARLRGTLPLPGAASFRQVNVRTYVTDGERPGIWFLSLDVSSRPVVEAVRRSYGLPCFHARIELAERAGRHECSSARRGGARPHVLSASYRPRGEPAPAEPGSLPWFLAERYCLYAAGRDGALRRAEVHHPPWALREAEARIELNTMAPDGIELGGEPPLCHYSARQDVLIWPPEPVVPSP